MTKNADVRDTSRPVGQSRREFIAGAVKDLIAAIEEDRRPLANLEESRTNLEMIVAVFESHRVGGLVTFPLKNRKNPLTMLET